MEAKKIVVSRRIRHSDSVRSRSAVVQKGPSIEGQQHRDWARGDVRKALVGCAAELGHPLRQDDRLTGIERAEHDRNRIPIHGGGSNAWALHVLRGRGKNASRERDARNSESQHDAPYLAGAVAATSGRESSIAVVDDSAKWVNENGRKGLQRGVAELGSIARNARPWRAPHTTVPPS